MAGDRAEEAGRAGSRFADSRGIRAGWEFLPTLHASRSVPIVLRPRADYPVLAWLGAIGRLSWTLTPPALVGLAAADAAAGGVVVRARGRGTGPAGQTIHRYEEGTAGGGRRAHCQPGGLRGCLPAAFPAGLPVHLPAGRFGHRRGPGGRDVRDGIPPARLLRARARVAAFLAVWDRGQSCA